MLNDLTCTNSKILTANINWKKEECFPIVFKVWIIDLISFVAFCNSEMKIGMTFYWSIEKSQNTLNWKKN
jgi:hypothetical protein